jgi:hypothetical protein
MSFIELIGWSLVSAAAAWGMTVGWANLAFSRLRRSMQQEVEYWKGEAARARDMATYLQHEVATWSRGAKQGREDLMAMMPLLVAAHEQLQGSRTADAADARA